jgi:hypothetical protein
MQGGIRAPRGVLRQTERFWRAVRFLCFFLCREDKERSDLRYDYFSHRLRIPPWLSCYCVLPAVVAISIVLASCGNTLPRTIAECITEDTIEK